MTTPVSWTQRISAVLGFVILVPINVLLALATLFDYQENGILEWTFLCFAIYLDIPALLVGLFRPKLGAWWVFFNAVISGVMLLFGGIHAMYRGMPPHVGADVRGIIIHGAFLVAILFVVIWGAKFTYFLLCSGWSQRRSTSVVEL